MSKMRDEIREQPAVLERTLQAERGPIEELRRVLERDPPRLIMLAARGTSDNAAQFGRYLLEMTTGIPVTLAAPSIFTFTMRRFASTAYWWWPFRNPANPPTPTSCWSGLASKAPALSALQREGSSALSKIAQHLFLVHAGRERSVAATKTYTGQLLLLYLLAYALGADIALDDLARVARVDQPRVDARTRHRAPGRALSLHGARRRAGPRAQLRQRVRVCAEADGNLLRGGRAVFERRPAAWSHRDAGSVVSGIFVRAGGRHLARYSRNGDNPQRAEGRDADLYRCEQRGGRAGSPFGNCAGGVGRAVYANPYIIPAQLFAPR